MNYQRILSYLYDYDRGVKRKNIGFVKLETRGDLCRVNIHLKLPAQLPAEPLHACFFSRRNDEILGIRFADVTPVGNECNVRTMVPASFFEAWGILPDEFAGVYISREGQKDMVFASAWDDEPVYVETFREIRSPAEQAPENETEIASALEEENCGEKISITAEENPGGEVRAMEQGSARDIIDGSEAVRLNRTPWEELAKNFTKFRIIEGDTTVECLKIRPHHLALLPRRYWNDTNGSFLLHGYYTYGHLILARREPGEEYFLGIPGKNRDRDRVMAAYYGYTKYLPMGQKNRGSGYWCREVTLQDTVTYHDTRNKKV